jgi:Tfp pilus assembly protein FimT
MERAMPIRRKAFTLTEMLVVISIIILLIAVAVPSIRALTGSSSTSVARNELSSLITHAREEAVAIQDIRGVLFLVDSANDRVTGVIVKPASLQDTAFQQGNGVLLDVVSGGDSLTMPAGIRIQTVFNGLSYLKNTATPQADDRYLGFNSPANGATMTVGGCILFDGFGRLITRPYGIQMNGIPDLVTTSPATNLAILLGLGNGSGSYNTTVNGYGSGSVKSSAYIIGQSGNSLNTTTAQLPLSQLGLVIFDNDTFKSLGFGDQDAVPGNPSVSYNSPPAGQTQNESDEETWIDKNSTPVMINRFTGTLIRGE